MWSGPGGRRKSNEAGFSLLEVLVALAIASMTLVGFHQALAGSLGLYRGAGTRSEAALLASALLDRAAAEPERARSEEGRSAEGLAWRVSVTRGAALATPAGELQLDNLIRITVSVQDGAKPLEITTLRSTGSGAR